jgi:hypothetical protein
MGCAARCLKLRCDLCGRCVIDQIIAASTPLAEAQPAAHPLLARHEDLRIKAD